MKCTLTHIAYSIIQFTHLFPLLPSTNRPRLITKSGRGNYEKEARTNFDVPLFFTALTNLYRSSAELFLGLNTLLSQEGTTQGDPLPMPFFALATKPLMNTVSADMPEVKQVWYADDATAAGKIADLRSWWSKIATLGPAYGYFVNPS